MGNIFFPELNVGQEIPKCSNCPKENKAFWTSKSNEFSQGSIHTLCNHREGSGNNYVYILRRIFRSFWHIWGEGVNTQLNDYLICENSPRSRNKGQYKTLHKCKIFDITKLAGILCYINSAINPTSENADFHYWEIVKAYN